MRRIGPDGRVFPVAQVSPGSAPTTVVARVPATTPQVQTDSVLANQESFAVEASDAASLGGKGDELVSPGPGKRRPARRPAVLESPESVMPPRPASASEKGSSSRVPARLLLPEDDHETGQISGGFASGLATLFKVTLVLSAFTLLTVCTYLYWNDLLPWSPQTASTEPPRKPVETEVAVAKPTERPPAIEIKPDVAAVPTETVAAVATAQPEVVKHDPQDFPPVVPTPEATPAPKKPDVPQTEAGIGADADYDVHRVEQLRAEAVTFYRQGRVAKTRADAVKKYDEAIKKLDELLSLKAKDQDALFRKGNVLDVKGDQAEAAKAYEAAAALSVTDARPWNNLGLMREGQRDFKGARAAFEKALACDPRNPDVLTNLGRLEMSSDPKSALLHFDRALEQDDRYVYPRYNRAILLALKLNRADEAKKELEKLAQEESPLRADSLQMLGDVAMSTGQVSEAETYYQRALAANPDIDKGHLSLGLALYARGDNEKAERELSAYLEKHPKSADGWKTLGAALGRLGRLKDQKTALEKALELDEKDPELHYDYAICAERFGNFNFAIPEYERVLKLDPKHWKALSNLARLYHVAGREQTAIDYVERSIAIQPGWANSHLLRANVLVKLDRKTEARTALEQFVKLATPGDKRRDEVKRLLESQGDLTNAVPDAPPPEPGAPK